MKQALAQLGAAQRAQQRRVPTAARKSARQTHGGVQALDRHGECVRATLLFARWQRCGMGRISLMNGCACGIDAAIEIGGLEAMILDHLLQRFVHRPGLAPVLQAALAQADTGRQALSDLLECVAQPHNALTTPDMNTLLDALSVSIASIEEHSAMR
jgi:hypothetical protein